MKICWIIGCAFLGILLNGGHVEVWAASTAVDNQIEEKSSEDKSDPGTLQSTARRKTFEVFTQKISLCEKNIPLRDVLLPE